MTFSFLKRHRNKLGLNNQLEPNITYKAVALTDKGAVRENNEDSVLFVKPFDKERLSRKGFLAVLADGMGGHNHGEIASKLAIEIVSKYYYEQNNTHLDALKNALHQANDVIFQKSKTNQNLKGMGTTCTAAAIVGKDIYVAHIGDSRAYLITEKSISQLSKDHTYVQHLVDQGMIQEHEKNSHPERNVIMRAMGTQPSIIADLKQYKNAFASSAKLLLCSDGLYDYLSDSEIQQSVLTYNSFDAAEKMTREAISRGGHDNISIIIVEPNADTVVSKLHQTQEIN